MKKVEDELHRCEDIILSGNKDFLSSREYKDDREWWILGKVAECLQKANQGFPVLAHHQDPPDPDFITFNDQKSKFKPVEITEVLLPNRKRGDEIKIKNDNEEENYSCISLPWESFEDVINTKFTKRYERDCWLFIYHNISSIEVLYNQRWHDAILTQAEIWNVNNLSSVNLSLSPYEKILVLNSGGDSLVSIYPEIKILIPEIN